MPTPPTFDDGLCKPALTLRPHQLLSTVCTLGGLQCPLMAPDEAREVLTRLKADPTLTIRLHTDADEVPYHFVLWSKPEGAAHTAVPPSPERRGVGGEAAVAGRRSPPLPLWQGGGGRERGPGGEAAVAGRRSPPLPLRQGGGGRERGPGGEAAVLNRKRDLDVLQRLGLAPGDTRRARYLYTLLFERIETPDGICAFDTPGWEGCPQARSGAYESIREQGWQAVVYARSEQEMAEYRRRNVEHIQTDECLFIRPHHLMCMACWYAGGEGTSPRPNDTIYEIHQRIRKDPDILITLVEGCCDVCDCCDGFHPETTRCVHAGGLIRDYKKDLDVFQKLGLMPGATMPAKALIDLLFERIHSTREICGYEDGIVRSEEWSICGGPEGNPGYERSREAGLL